EQHAHAAGVQVPGLKEQQGEEEGALMGRDESEQPALGLRLFVAPGKHVSPNIRVMVEVGGVAVVSIVFVDPPAITEPNAQIRHDDADEVVPSLGREQLLVTRVVAEEAELCENDSEIRSDCDLPP